MILSIHLLCHRSFFVFRLPTSTVERDASIIHENVLACYALALFSYVQKEECLSTLGLIVASGFISVVTSPCGASSLITGAPPDRE
jgi:hypothetical protein